MVAANETQSQPQSGKSPNSKEASPSKVAEQSPEDLKQEATTVLATGKRYLLVSDIPQAVSSLGEACELLTKVYGETAAECAEAYFFYGKALLEMARLESGVLGNALDGVPDGDDQENSQVEDPDKLTDEEKGDVEEKVDEALGENFDKHDKIAKIHKGEDLDGDGDKSEEEDSQEEAEEDGETETENGEAKKDESEGADKAEVTDKTEVADKAESEAEKPKDDETNTPMETEGEKTEDDGSDVEGAEDDEPSNLQLAWEMLEVAKVVYTKTAETQKDAETSRRLCETYMVLGEVSLENGNYPQAVEDLSICLQRRKEALAADSRCIAETHYQLGIAQGFEQKWEEAVGSLQAAIKVLETRIGNLKAEAELTEESKKEIAELEALVPEIKEKITDTNDLKAENLRKNEEVKEKIGFTSGSSSAASSSASSSKPIASIAIKRKAEDKEGEAKKAKEDLPVSENGDSKTT